MERRLFPMDLIFIPIGGAALDSLITLWGIRRHGRRIESNPIISYFLSRIGTAAALVPLAIAIPVSVASKIFMDDYFMYVLGLICWYPVVWNLIVLAVIGKRR